MSTGFLIIIAKGGLKVKVRSDKKNQVLGEFSTLILLGLSCRLEPMIGFEPTTY